MLKSTPVKFIALLLCAVLMAPAAAQAALGHRSWTLRTDDTELRLSSADNCPVIESLGERKRKHNWLGGAMAVPLMDKVWVADRVWPTTWRLEWVQDSKRTSKLTFCFTNAEPRLALHSIWRARPGPGPIEHWLEIENRSGQRITLFHQDSLVLTGLRPAGPATAWWIKRGGGNADTEGGTFQNAITNGFDLTLASNCTDGASPVPWLAVQAGSERGLYVGWEFSGLGRIRVKANLGQIELRVGNHPEFKTDLEPGETFRVPPAFIGCYQGEVDDGSYCLHRFVLEKLRPPLPQHCPDPVLAYNLYLDARGNQAREADVLRSAATCRDLGFEVFMPDAMWFPETGDWRWDPARFEKGVAPIEEFVHGSGMRLALWCAWSNGGLAQDENALNIRRHPDWFNADYGADWKPGPFSGAELCLGCEEAKRWAIEKTLWLVSHHRLDYLKHDADPITVQCNKTSHRHRYGVDASYWATLGYYEVQEQLLKSFPGLLLENCSGGGHIKDFGVVQRSHYTVATDTLSNLPDRRSIYDSTFALPPLLLQAYTYDNYYPVRGDNPGTFLWRSAMMGAWQIDPTDTAKWTEAERDSARQSVCIYKQWIRPLLKDAKVHHILPRPDGEHWDGLLYWSPSLAKGVVYIFRPDSSENRQVVRLKGLNPNRRYWVWCEDSSIRPGPRKGEELMQTGLLIRLPEPYTSDLIFLQEVSRGQPSGFDPPGEFRLAAARPFSDLFAAGAELSWQPSPRAHAYRVLVAERPQFENPGIERVAYMPSLSLPALAADRQFFWRVEAIGPGGVRTNLGGELSFRTPELVSRKGITFASDLAWAKATAGADNEVRRDKNYAGRTITIDGKPYPKGLWTHSFNDETPADIVCDIALSNFVVFKAQVGLDDLGEHGSVQFQVLVNGQVKAETPILRPRQVHPLVVDVTGASRVTLRVLNGGDGYSCDHAAWGLARFAEPGAKDPFE